MLYQNLDSLLKTLLPVQPSQMVAIFFFITTYHWAEGKGMCPWSSLALSVHGSYLNPLAHLLLITLLSDYITYYTSLLQPMLQSPPPVQSPLFIPGFSSWVHSFSQLLVSSFLEISISMWSLHTYIVYIVNNPCSTLASQLLEFQSKDLILLPSSATHSNTHFLDLVITNYCSTLKISILVAHSHLFLSNSL